jgi:hypothetical protein
MVNKNSIATGVICGIIIPSIVFFLLHTFTFNRVTPEYLFSSPGIVAKLLSLSLLGNLAAFFLFLKYDFELSARGVLFATFVWGAGIALLKILEWNGM